MALHFVSTSILSSEDGIDFSKETQVESEEARKLRLEKEKSAAKPLYLQLAEQQEKQQQERDQITKMIFAPPKALDDEEFEFLSTIEQNKQRFYNQTKQEEESEIERFRNIAKSANSIPSKILTTDPSSSNPATAQSNSSIAAKTSDSVSTVQAPVQIPLIRVKKRKVEGSVSKESHDVIDARKAPAPTETKQESVKKPVVPSSLAMLSEYPSSDED